MTFKDKHQLIRTLCVTLVTVALLLALLLLIAVCGDSSGDGNTEETTRRIFHPSYSDGTIDPEDISIDWEPDGSGGSDGSGGTGELPVEPDVTLPDWDGGMEWPTLPPTLETDPDFELPTLPEDWDTLPEEWDTLPEEWGDLPIDPDDLADVLAGMDGSLGMAGGALAAGVASQLTVMEIYAKKTDTLYLMMQAFGDYTGQGWADATEYKTGATSYEELYIPGMLMNAVTFEVYPLSITPKMNSRVIPYYVTGEENPDDRQTNDTKAVGFPDRTYTLYYRPYGAYANVYFTAPALNSDEEKYAAFVRQQYLTVDDTTLAYMKLIIEEQGFTADDPDIVEKVATYIQNAATYNLAYDQNLDREPNVALAFLGAYKEGVCRHYATAATLLYRALGIPARYTVGFMTDVTGGETTAVKGSDAHAWVEVYEDGFGWRCVEVTGYTYGDGPGGDTGDRPIQGDTSDRETLPVDPETTPDGTDEPTAEPETEQPDPADWGALMAGVKGSLATPQSVPPAMFQNTVLTLRSDTSDRVLLKIKSFGDYTGQGFDSGAVYNGGLIYETYSWAYLPGLYLARKEYVTHYLYVDAAYKTAVAPYFVSLVDFIPPITVGDTVITGADQTQYTLHYYAAMQDLTYKPVGSPLTNEPSYRAFAYENYLGVDEETASYLAVLISREGWDGSDPAVITQVAEYLRALYPILPGNQYDTALDWEENAVVSFLKDPTTVTPRHLAAAATLIYRMLGIPARYTVGYLAQTSSSTAVAITGEDAYAWVEVYVDGYGWLPVDVAERDFEEHYTVTLKPEDMAVQYTGESVAHSGILEGFEKFAALGYTYDVTVSGTRRTCGHTITTIQSIRIYDGRGVDVTHLFDITTKAGDLFVYLEELQFISYGQTKVYDGTPITTEVIRMISGNLPEGYSLVLTHTGTQTLVGSVYAAFEVKVMYDAGNGYLTDRTDNYFLIRKSYGTLRVTPASLTLKAADAEKVIDGSPLTANSLEIVEGSLAEGDYIARYSVEGSRTMVGRSQNVITSVTIFNKNGEDVTRCYTIDTLPGTLRVLPADAPAA